MIFIVLPAFNEQDSIPALFPKISQKLVALDEPYQIIVCNDGSDDNTALSLNALKAELPITILDHSINRGLGEAMRTLFEYVASVSADGDVIVRLDCDDTHEPKYISKLVEKVNEGYDVVIASRFEAGGGQVGVVGYRAFISRCANIFMKTFFPIKGLKEYSCGYRAFSASIVKRAINFYGNNFIQLKGLGFTCTLEKLIKLNMIGARFAEVPFILRYDQKVSSSKMVSSVTTMGYLVMTVLYHWPWGGWRRAIRKDYANWRLPNDRC